MWHSGRKRAALESGRHTLRRSRENDVVARIERDLRRRVTPFSLDFIVLPVRDDEVRLVAACRYLVSERVYDGPDWPEILRPLVLRADATAS